MGIKKEHTVLIEIGVMLLLLGIATEAVTQKLIVEVPGSYVINGKNITVIGMSKDKISVDVDGVLANVEKDTFTNVSKNVNGVYIHVIGISKSPPRVIINVTVNINCGNNKCEVGEDFTICCTDCGCGVITQICSANRCRENITQPGAKHECFSLQDCDDKNPCTTEACDTSAYPNKCVKTDITACTSNDRCCPKLCDTPQDADCANIDKCDTVADCDDGEVCTKDACAGAPKRCAHESTEGCTIGNTCVPKGTNRENTYCEGISHQWKVLKSNKQPCEEDYECVEGLCAGKQCGKREGKTLRYAFYTVTLLAILLILWYATLKKKAKPIPQS